MCFTVIPNSVAGASRSRADTNWLDEDASISTTPPFTLPEPLIVIGRRYLLPCSILIPNCSRALITGASGRSWDLASPSKWIKPVASAAIGGKKRITVPALPTSIWVGPVNFLGVTR